MRILAEVRFPHSEFNEAVRDGIAGKKIARILDELKPEAVYFTELYGQRAAILIINVDDPAQIPEFAEPFFLQYRRRCGVSHRHVPGGVETRGA